MVPQTSESLFFQAPTELGWFVLPYAGHPVSQTHKNVTLSAHFSATI